MSKNEYQQVGRESRWFVTAMIPTILIVVAVAAVIGAAGKWGRTALERKVFEQSYQRSEGLKARVAIEEATIAGIEARLDNPRLDDDTRAVLRAQLVAARARLSAARRQQ